MSTGCSGILWDVHGMLCGMPDWSAANMKAAIDSSSPMPLPIPDSAADVCGLCLGADRISGNRKLIVHYMTNASERCVVWPGLCRQHASGLVIAPVVKELKLVSPAFCMAKQFKRGRFNADLLEGMREVMAQDFRWIQVARPRN